MMPNCKKSSDQDALIVESLVSFFHRLGEPVTSLFFWTKNTGDFALEVKTNGFERRFVLDPKIQTALPQAHFSTDLAFMQPFLKGYEELPHPTSDEIDNAVKLRDSHDIDDEEYGELHQLLMDTLHKESANQFDRDFMPLIPPEIRDLRQRLS